MLGVAMVTSEGNWLVGKKFFLKHGFASVESAPPSFNLMVKKFKDAPSPSFTKNQGRKLSRYGQGLTVFRSDQCPYIENAVKIVLEMAKELGIKCQVVELNNCLDVRSLAPSAFGVFAVVYNGKLMAYHYIGKKDLLKRIADLRKMEKTATNLLYTTRTS
jgi:hypothetical protein